MTFRLSGMPFSFISDFPVSFTTNFPVSLNMQLPGLLTRYLPGDYFISSYHFQIVNLRFQMIRYTISELKIAVNELECLPGGNFKLATTIKAKDSGPPSGVVHYKIEWILQMNEEMGYQERGKDEAGH
ncbi:hypothetical protein K435DRAFT_813784 [Dendrothele bispora CBS 962.96]|uniref:Uncharacterized protein n=1 Tax=Dendrothele bispora (strain CBS 962.96) TaxID=1314807 RepID=A0A4V6T4V1_DENBC|nr:hypothetical protein K435DRAFT_813830 [Dendrothele bispora CBS 962.96]THU76064.1 hypothetical protein K435DRAFT_813784 [Dendrothele bispora CBS 962.96]